ncbi:L-fucose:H+ symporter permease [Sphingomonas sp. PB2P19]|uniref:L-fucose:H+ symporter permease n=1 Tax=Sphingomonas rhamnosi TaxID=3096156 RepID=UPI002FC8F0B9
MMADAREARASRMATVLIIGLFFLWGLANNLNDVLVAHFRSVFRLSDFQSGLVQSAFYLGYFCFAIPAALASERFGYKRAVIGGLLLFAAGALLFWPASVLSSYPFFLLGLFVIASGLAFLETAANPMVMVLGPAAGAERRLNLAQSFNPLGSITGVGLGAMLILSNSASAVSEARSVQLPYLAIAGVVLIWAALLAMTRLPDAAVVPTVHAPGEQGATLAGFAALLRRPRFLAGVAAQFFYVGAQVGIWSYLIRYVDAALPLVGEQRAAGLLTLSLALFMAGRFAGTALLARVGGARLMAAFALVNVALTGFAAIGGGGAGVAALVLSSFFMSIMYPTIFVLSLRGLGPLTKPGASMIVMAIIGGAVVTAVMGLVSDLSGAIRWAMLVPAVCFLVVGGFARLHRADRP